MIANGNWFICQQVGAARDLGRSWRMFRDRLMSLVNLAELCEI